MEYDVSEALVSLRDVRVRYNRGPFWARSQFDAVRGVDLVIAPGETLGLVGESGSGKTTIGRLCLGLQQPTSGEVRFHGAPLAQAMAGRRRLAAVLQNPRMSLNPRLRIGTSIAEPLRIAGVDAASRVRKVSEKLERVSLQPDLARRYPHELSGGQRQRASIARALNGDPEFILFDEPVSALDVSIQAQILNMILDLQADLGFAALFISHDFAATRYVAQKIAVMLRGEIVDSADSAALFAPAAHPYTRQLQQASGLL
jgi:ABC-type glutathione transport system ATPase component